MSTRNRKKRRGLAQTLLNWGVLGSVLLNAGQNQQQTTQRATMEELRAENLELKNKHLVIDDGYHSNRVVEGDVKIEERQLKVELLRQKLAREKFVNQAMGVDAPPMEALDYPDPGERGGN